MADAPTNQGEKTEPPAAEEAPGVDVAISDDGKLHMLNRLGVAVTIPRESLGEALQRGYTPETSSDVVARETKAERETFGQQALTVAEGGLHGATFGLGTAVAAEFGGDEYREAARERMAVNPNLYVAGEVAGTVAPSLLSGGSGALAKVAGATPASLVSRGAHIAESAAGRLLRPLGESFGAKVAKSAIESGVGGLVEGAAYGLGTSLAESALEGTEWTAERAISAAGHGALYGAGIGGGVGAAGPVLSKASRKILDRMIGEGKTLRQAVGEWADKRVISTVVGDDARIFRQITDEGTNMGRLERVADSIRNAGVKNADELPRVLAKQADDAIRTRAQVVRQLDDFGVRPKLAPEAVDELADGIARMREAGTSDHTAIAERLEKTLTEFQKREGGETFADLFKLRTGLDDAARFARQTKNVGQEEVGKLTAQLTRRIDDAADVASPEVGKLWRDSQQKASDLLLLKEGIIDAGERRAMSKAAGGSGLQTGLMGALTTLVMSGGAALPSIAVGMASSAAHRFIRERGAAGLGWIADRVARVELRTSRAAEVLAGVGVTATKAGRKAAPEVLETQVADRAKSRASTGRRGAIVALSESDRSKRYQSLRTEALNIARDPMLLAKRVERAIAPIAASQPEVAQAMGRRMIRDHLYLLGKMPVTSTSIGETLTPGADEPLVSKFERDKWLRSHDALEDPPSAIESLAGGVVDWEAVDALKENRPELWQSFAERTVIAASKRDSELPYKQKVYISLLFDIPTDWSMTPAGMTAIADAAAYVPPGEESQGPGRGSPSSLDADAIGGGMQTPAQAATGGP